MRKKLVVVVGWLLTATLLVPAAGGAHEVQIDPTDPLDILTGWTYIQDHTLGADVMEVWVCHMPVPDQAIDPDTVVSRITPILTPYVDWLSGSRKSISFVAGGEVTLAGNVPDIDECLDLIFPLASSDAISSNGAVLVFDVETDIAVGGTGLGPQFPINERIAVYGVNHVSQISDLDESWLAHEIGHTMHLPHSYTGLLVDLQGDVFEYDNLYDVMSGAETLIGTHALNRYAAGWIDPDQVVVYDGVAAETVLGPIGHAGDQLLVVPGPDPHTYAAIDVRTKTAGSYDSTLPSEGVTVHLIDERATACELPPAFPHCSGIERLVTPAGAFPYGDQHVYGPGEAFTVFDIEVLVASRTGDLFTIAAGDLPFEFPPGASVELNTLTETAVELSWSSALGADDYTISGGPTPVTVTEPSAIVSGLAPGTEYTFSVVGRQDAETTEPIALTVETLAAGGSRVGVQDPDRGFWEMVNSDASYNSFYYGDPVDLAVACDWDGDGVDTVGLYRPSNGFLYLRNSNTQGPGETEIFYGEPADIPVCGDWDGDGIESIGVYRPRNATFYLRNSNTQGFADLEFVFGNPGDIPFSGDWDGDGVDTVGLYRQSTGFVYITDENAFGVADFAAFYGNPGDRFVVGDWNGDGSDSFGIYRPAEQKFYLSNTIGQAVADIEISAGTSRSVPISGIFD